MKKKSTVFVLIVFGLTINFAMTAQQHRVNRLSVVQPSDNLVDIGIDNKSVPDTYISKDIIMKKARQVVNEGDKVLIYADYKYDRYGNISQKTRYSYDSMNRQTEVARYIPNNYSYNWMSGREPWICSYKLIKEYTTAGYTKHYELYNLDMTTGVLRGSSKYIREFKDIKSLENFDTMYESYLWNDTINNWKPDTKYTCDYVLNGTGLSEEDFYWNWDIASNSWVKDLTYKYTYNYTFQNNLWYMTDYKYFELINNVLVCSSQTITSTNYTTKNTQSQVTQVLVNGVMTNSERILYSYNNNKLSLIETSKWIDNQWKLSNENLYEYSLPDSIRTQTVYRTPVYYQYYNLTLPSLCPGQTLYPISKYITKMNTKSGLSELSYNYTWDKTLCNWKPASSRTLTTFDASGTKTLMRTYCPSYSSTDWQGCQFSTYSYNAKEKVSTIETTTDGLATKTKSEYVYLADTILYKINFYITEDKNGDGVVDTGWVYDGKLINDVKFAKKFDSDSVFLVNNTAGLLQLYNLENVKKIKIDGVLGCEDLRFIAQLSKDSLSLADLSDASIEGDTLKNECFGNIGLNTLILPKSLVGIEQGAVLNEYIENERNVLTNLVIYPNLKYFAKYGIQAMSLKNITVSSKYFNNVFEFEQNIKGINDVYKTSLESVTFNDVTGKIADAICYNMPYLKSVVIQDGVSEIGNNAFKSCGMLSSIQFPSTSLRKIGYNAFWGCNELNSLIIPEGTNSIDYGAFWGCSGVTSIVMPSTLSTIGQNAFWGCSTVNSMKVSAAIPPVLGNNSLLGIPRDINLVVPAEGLNIYKVSPQWKEFYNMNTDVISNKQASILIFGSNHQLNLQNIPENSTVQVFNLAGIKLIELNNPAVNTSLNIDKGIYLVKIGTMRYKTIIE